MHRERVISGAAHACNGNDILLDEPVLGLMLQRLVLTLLLGGAKNSVWNVSSSLSSTLNPPRLSGQARDSRREKIFPPSPRIKFKVL